MKKKIIQIFEKVQKIPYKVCKFEKSNINEDILSGDCRHKSELLYLLLKKAGFEVKKIKVIFDWKDISLPNEILSILKKSDSVWTHDSLKVKISDKWIKVDCTWNPELEKKGFPITKKWNGKTETKQVTEGKLKFYDIDSKEYLRKKEKINIDKEEAYKFANALNEYIKE